MPADRDRAHLGRAGRLRRLRLADRHEPERRRRDRAPRRATCRASPPSGPARPRRCARTGSSRRSSPRESSQDGLLREFPRPAGRVLFAAAEGARRGPIDELGRRLRRRSTARGCSRPRRPRATSSCSPPARRRARTPRSAAPRPRSSIGPETSRVARAVGLDVAAEAATHDLDGLVAAVRDLMDSRRMSTITFLTDFGLAGRLRRHLPRRDRADRARRARDRPHARHRRRRPCCRARSCCAAPSRSCRSACTSPSSIPTSAGTAARSPSARADGRMFVGPDNGLLMLAADALGRRGCARADRPALPAAARCRTRSTRATSSRPLPRTSPPASRSAELGPALDPATLVRVAVPEPEIGRTQISATVLVIDRFGNVATNARREHVDGARARRRRPRRDPAHARPLLRGASPSTFADAAPGELILYEDSYGLDDARDQPRRRRAV